MLKKLSIKTNFILIGIVVGLFVGVSVRQALGDTTDVPGTVRADNLTVNTSGQYTNGLIVANGNALVSGNVGIGTVTPTVKLDVVGDIKTTGSIKSNNLCIGATCINENQLQALLAVGGTGTDGTGGTASAPTAATINLSISGTTITWASSNANSCRYRVNYGAWMNLSPLLNGTLSLLGKGFSIGTTYTISLRCVISSDSSGYEPWTSVTYTPTE